MKTIHMKKADHEKWDAALRGGEYKQGFGALRTVEDGVIGYCCLGVLQQCLTGDVERQPGGASCGLPTIGWLAEHGIEFSDGDDGYPGNDFEGNKPFLPMLGTTADNANDGQSGGYNDSVRHGHYDFIQIADAIKEAVEYTDA